MKFLASTLLFGSVFGIFELENYSSGQVCPIYTCQAPKNNFQDESVCSQYEGNAEQGDGIYYLRECKNNTICDFSNKVNNVAKCAPSQLKAPKKPNGASCYYDYDCSSDYCDSGYCKFNNKERYCGNSTECSVAEYCDYNGQCSVLYKLGETGCSNFLECEPDTSCHIVSRAQIQKNMCKKYFSLPNGEKLLNCDREGKYLCQSGYCDPTNNVCAEAPTILGPFPRNCTTNSTLCMADISGKLKTSDCSCGWRSDGSKFCEPFDGDKPYAQLNKYWKQWFDSGKAKNCSTDARFNLDCIRAYKPDIADYIEYYSAYAGNFAKYYNATDCVIAVMSPSFNKDIHDKDDHDNDNDNDNDNDGGNTDGAISLSILAGIIFILN